MASPFFNIDWRDTPKATYLNHQAGTDMLTVGELVLQLTVVLRTLRRGERVLVQAAFSHWIYLAERGEVQRFRGLTLQLPNDGIECSARELVLIVAIILAQVNS